MLGVFSLLVRCIVVPVVFYNVPWKPWLDDLTIPASNGWMWAVVLGRRKWRVAFLSCISPWVWLACPSVKSLFSCQSHFSAISWSGMLSFIPCCYICFAVKSQGCTSFQHWTLVMTKELVFVVPVALVAKATQFMWSDMSVNRRLRASSNCWCFGSGWVFGVGWNSNLFVFLFT